MILKHVDLQRSDKVFLRFIKKPGSFRVELTKADFKNVVCF